MSSFPCRRGVLQESLVDEKLIIVSLCQFWSPGNLELFVLCPPPANPKKKGRSRSVCTSFNVD